MLQNHMRAFMALVDSALIRDSVMMGRFKCLAIEVWRYNLKVSKVWKLTVKLQFWKLRKSQQRQLLRKQLIMILAHIIKMELESWSKGVISKTKTRDVSKTFAVLNQPLLETVQIWNSPNQRRLTTTVWSNQRNHYNQAQMTVNACQDQRMTVQGLSFSTKWKLLTTAMLWPFHYQLWWW